MLVNLDDNYFEIDFKFKVNMVLYMNLLNATFFTNIREIEKERQGERERDINEIAMQHFPLTPHPFPHYQNKKYRL